MVANTPKRMGIAWGSGTRGAERRGETLRAPSSGIMRIGLNALNGSLQMRASMIWSCTMRKVVSMVRKWAKRMGGWREGGMETTYAEV